MKLCIKILVLTLSLSLAHANESGQTLETTTTAKDPTISNPNLSLINDFETVDQLLDHLQTDASVKFNNTNGWLVAEREYTIWTFTTHGHQAHPSVIERRVYEEDGAIKIATQVKCAASESLCDNLLLEFQGLNNQLSEDISRPASPKLVTIQNHGFTVSFDKSEGWELSHRTPTMLAIKKKGLSSGESMVGSGQIYRLPKFSSDEEFLKLTREQRISSYGSNPQLLNMNMSEAITKLKATTCIAYSYRYIVKDAKLTDGSRKDMNFANEGLRCIHPENETIGLDIGFSTRYFDKLDEPRYLDAADNFHNNISFSEIKILKNQ